jgi:hypothetical protein
MNLVHIYEGDKMDKKMDLSSGTYREFDDGNLSLDIINKIVKSSIIYMTD